MGEAPLGEARRPGCHILATAILEEPGVRMDSLAFCRQVMADYEEQWAEAHGHQERHPLKVKMNALEALMDRVRQGEDLERLIQQGCNGDDPLLYLLCADLRAKWGHTRVK